MTMTFKTSLRFSSPANGQASGIVYLVLAALFFASSTTSDDQHRDEKQQQQQKRSPDIHQHRAINKNKHHVPEHVLERVKRKGAVKDSWSPTFQTIRPEDETFEIHGYKVDMKHDFIPVADIFATGATVSVDGVPQAGQPVTHVYTSKRNPHIRALLDDDRNLIKASLTKSNGDLIDLVHIYHHEFAERDHVKDVDPAKLLNLRLVSACCL